jgi:GNAT superfamily N-acetyltransferase
MMDAFGEEIASVDPKGRCIRLPGCGRVEVRSERERLAVIDFRNGVVPQLYVAPEWRRHGSAGRSWRDSTITSARRMWGDLIEVFAPNGDARRFYSELGYEERTIWLCRWL